MTTPRMSRSSRLVRVVTVPELATAGTSRAQLRRLVAQGALVRVSRGRYTPAALAGAAPNDRAVEHALLVAAALARLAPGVVASHHSAALVHSLDLLGRRPAGTVAVTRVPGGPGSRTGRPGVLLHLAALPAGHVVARYGIPVTSVARTVSDLARTCSFRDGVAVADSALRTGQTSKAELAEVIAACLRWPGIQGARQVAAYCDARSESALESVSRVAFRDQGLPPPELQAWIGDEAEVIGRADFLWRAFRTIAEADGAIKYADPVRAMAQLERDRRLREAGFEVVHFTWPEITRTPERVAASIVAAFRRGTRSRIT
jgi:predicted transcriptional regulator of viral defense system